MLFINLSMVKTSQCKSAFNSEVPVHSLKSDVE
jgi:hypothetical protein